MDFYNPFCSGQNFILSQQPSQINLLPAPRHSIKTEKENRFWGKKLE